MKLRPNALFLSLFFFMTFISTGLIAEEAPPAPPQDQGFTQTLVMVVMISAFFYLIVWRPEQKRRREMEDSRSGLKKGDEVTAMGILGNVSKVEEHTVILRMVDGAKIRFLKSAITDVQHPSSKGDDNQGA